MPTNDLPITITQKLMRLHNTNHHVSIINTSTTVSKAHDQERGLLGNVGLALNFGLRLASNVLRILPIAKQFLGPPTESEAIIDALIAQQKIATSYEEWKEISLKLDELLGNEEWKQNPVSDLYDYELISLRLNQIRHTRATKDYKKLLYLIRTTWNRNIGNIGNVNNYRHSYVGTKKLIEEYLHECEVSLKCLLEDNTGLDNRYILGMLIQTRKAIGRTALVLSGGGCYGLIHIGVIATLLEQDLLPKIISGSSAGAIVASILSVHNSSEISSLLADVLRQEFIIFTEPQKPGEENSKLSLFANPLRFLRTGNWFNNAYLIETMKNFLGDLTFREAYNRTGRILNVTVSPASFHEQPSLLNYITSPNVLIWSAVCASCALPGVFPSTIIYEKDPVYGTIREWNHISVRFVDGSVDNDLPITRLSEMFNVDHIIACQVNPHVTPFLKLSLACTGGEIELELSAKIKSYFNSVYNYFTSEFIHYLEISQEVGVARNLSKKLTSVLTQRYSGDITILPDLRITELNKLLSNPTPEYILDAAVRGARSTWQKIGIINNHCGVEFILDRAILELRSKLISNSDGKSGVPLAFVNSPINSDNYSEEEFNMKDNSPLISDRLSPAARINYKLRRRQRSESYSNVFGELGYGSREKIKSLQSHNLRRQSSISALRRRDSSESFSGSSNVDNDNQSTAFLKYYADDTSVASDINKQADNAKKNPSFGPIDWDLSNPSSPLAKSTKNIFESSFKSVRPQINRKVYI
ncbi:triacylglycerol lipase [Saccharomycopsis crataegensis]|uniref:Patatin-like phospholipase domain-containing protein n=1 Tax=Saccharomycopsis crataegensis TaxID=43959 RepID=A0AAV5QHW6_9ASCO|nr:triacylglycerol lipase [Saccharomycopsis crataegensis]